MEEKSFESHSYPVAWVLLPFFHSTTAEILYGWALAPFKKGAIRVT